MSNVVGLKLRTLTLLATASLLIFAVILLWPKMANAEADDMAWSWTTAAPTVFSSNEIADISSTPCFTSYQMRDIDGELGDRKVCVQEGEKINFGTSPYAWWGYLHLVSFKYDSKMYKFRGPCDRFDSCLYLPGSDTLVTKQYLINGYVRSLVVYKNFTNRLRPVINMLSMEYQFDDSNPDYIFQSANNYAWPIGGFGASDNGKWLAVEFRQRGIGLLNTETLEMKRISTLVFSYDTGYNPTTELAVSNDGHHVAVMGTNAGFAILDVDSNCGDETTDIRMSDIIPIAQPCRQAQISVSSFINSFYAAIRPRFNDDGGELNFYAQSSVNPSREITLQAAGYSGQRLDYLALGDSFTSGEGETDDKYYQQGTNDEFEKCHVSTRSYPYLLASLSNIDPAYMRSVACSGAKTIDVIGDDYSYWGQGERLGEKNMNLSKVDRTFSQTQAKYLFLPGRVRQESFVTKYKPSTITVGIGGNDAGFMEKLRACIGFDTCNWATDAKKKEQSAVEIKNLFKTLTRTYQKIHDTSPNSKIYVVGYPKVIDKDGTCGYLLGKLLDNDEKWFMYEGISYLNKVIAAAARAVGIKYIDVQDSYGDRVLCGSLKPYAINDIRTGDDYGPTENLKWAKIIGQESFHPNSLGHSLVAASINKSVGNIMDYDYCGDGATTCPVETSAPEPSSYWIPNIYHDYPIQNNVDFIANNGGPAESEFRQITLSAGSFQPNSPVNIEVASTPMSLGQFITNNDGSLDVSVNLPTSLEEGYHTVHLYGYSYSGEPIELYQVIEYWKPYVAPVEPPVIEETPDTGDKDSGPTNTQETDKNNVPSTSDEVNEPISSGQLGDLAYQTDKRAVKGASIINDKLKTPVNKGGDSSFSNRLMLSISASTTFLIVILLLAIRLLRKIKR